MKFYKPQLQLARTNVLSDDGVFATQYTLHAITLCRRTGFRADGHTVGDEVENGILSVTLRIRQDADLPDLEYITPVVHTIDLGDIDADQDEVLIEVDVEATVLETADVGAANSGARMRSRTTTPATTATTKTGTKATVSSSDADDESRPGGHIS